MVDQYRWVGEPDVDSEVREAFAKILLQSRTERGIPQQDMAQLLGVSRAHYGHLERGTHGPSLVTVVRVARSLGISPSKLIEEIR